MSVQSTQNGSNDSEPDTEKEVHSDPYKGDTARIGYNDWYIPELTDQILERHQTAVCECGAHSANHGERHGKLQRYTGIMSHVYDTVMYCNDCGNWWIAYV